MRFLLRIFLGLTLFAAGVGAAGYGVLLVKDSIEQRRAGDGPGFGRPGSRERVFTVVAGEISPETISPRITAYGEIRSWRSLELRASSGGYLVELTDDFRDGAEVKEGALLFRIDPKDYVARVADARAALGEAKADLAEARQSIEVARRELAAADTQKNLRQTALQRQRDLLARGVSTSKAVEEAEMGLASAEQTAAGRAQAMLAAQIRIDRGVLRVERAEIALAEAERALAETEHHAPFSGLLANVNAVLGGLATSNEKLGLLIDPTALEAVFRVTNAQFARLLDDNGRLRPIDLHVTLELDDTPLTVPGTLDRAGAVVESGETGRLVYAKLDLEQATLLRPGDFVTVTIAEPPLSNVARLPSSAVTETGEILLIGEDDRLQDATVRILRRTGDDVIVGGAPAGARYVTERAPQLGRGVKVKTLTPPPAGQSAAMALAGEAAPELVTLEPEQQQRMIAFIEANQRMPAPVKQRILSRLKSGKAPQAMIDRITSRMGG